MRLIDPALVAVADRQLALAERFISPALEAHARDAFRKTPSLDTIEAEARLAAFADTLHVPRFGT